jgi:superfamily I DNA/RNA helicase
LCGFSDEELFELAHGRRDSLSAALKEKARERPIFEKAADLLARARDLGRSLTPFDFYARMLVLADGQDRSLRQRFATRLGPEAAEAIDAFLAEVLAAESRHIRDLERLCAEFERLDLTLKREMDAPRGEVRVMTAHGAKGLEYPVVFLVGLEEGFLPHRRTIEEASDFSEERRLCYVGITRAKEHLILSRAKTRIRYGKPVPRTPSRFLEEIPQELLVTRDESYSPDPGSKASQEAHEQKVSDFLSQIRAQLGAGKPARPR